MGKIAAIQTSSSDNVEQNLETAGDLISRAASQGAAVAVLPECFAFMQSSRPQLLENAENPDGGPIQAFLEYQSRDSGMWIVAGSVPFNTSNSEKVSNTQLVYNPRGEQVARYDKIFLFDVELGNGERYLESGYTEAGNSFSVIDSPVGKMGLSICYDLRFPEMYRKLTEMGAEVLLVPSAFSYTTGQYHWLPLLQARAIENGCYVVAPAQYGSHNGKRKTWGHTVIIDPWGRVISELESGAGIISAEVDLGMVSDSRQKLPTHSHFRPELFSDC